MKHRHVGESLAPNIHHWRKSSVSVCVYQCVSEHPVCSITVAFLLPSWFFPSLSRTRAENILKAEVSLTLCSFCLAADGCGMDANTHMHVHNAVLLLHTIPQMYSTTVTVFASFPCTKISLGMRLLCVLKKVDKL